MVFSKTLWKIGSSFLRRLLLLGVVVLALCACTDSAPKADKRLVAAFVEMRVAEQLYGGESPMGRLVRRDVLKKYGYTREEFVKACDNVLDDGKRFGNFDILIEKRPVYTMRSGTDGSMGRADCFVE